MQFIMFDDLVARPHAVLSSLCRFLELPYDRSLFSGAREKKNAGPVDIIPPAVRQKLSMQYIDDMVRLVEMFGGPTEAWLERARQSIQD